MVSLPMVATMVAREAIDVPMHTHCMMLDMSRLPFCGTTISQPGSILPLPT